ncbi:MAG: DnaJ domain-containing protein [Paludibacteraceae bacterium]|nr:DnaJ domain-containing protein [Paludibacteraceae bacterium]
MSSINSNIISVNCGREISREEYLAKLKSELAELFERREYMLTYEKSTLLAAYTKWIGSFKYEEFSLQVTIKRQQRKAQIIQAKINRNEPIVIEAVEQQLNEEFAEYERLLQEQLEQIKAATDYLESPVLSDEDAKELKQIYRILVKRLHPDWNPDLTQQERDLFVRVQAAYKTANLQELRNILLMIDAKEPTALQNTDIEKEIAQYEKSIADMKERIEKLELTFPFTMREMLVDEEQLKRQQEEIQANISKLREDEKKWMAYVAAMSMSRSGIGEA